MTKTITILAISSFVLNANAQTAEESLKANLQQLDSAKTVNEAMAASSAFDMTAMKFPNEPMVHYYAAYSKALLSYMLPETEMKRKDQVLDQGDRSFEKYKQLNPESDETYVLAALMANARMAVDGQNRWKKYGEIFDQNLEKAKTINVNNPRIYYLKGISTFYTPKMFGGGKKKAKPYFDKAKELYATQDNSSVLKPIWGEKQTDMYLKQCEE
jgi:hypothetical protein